MKGFFFFLNSCNRKILQCLLFYEASIAAVHFNKNVFGFFNKVEQNFYLYSLRHHKPSENSSSYNISALCNYYHEEHCLMWKQKTKPNYPLSLTSYLWRSKPWTDNGFPYNPPYSMFLFCFLFFPVKARHWKDWGVHTLSRSRNEGNIKAQLCPTTRGVAGGSHYGPSLTGST